MRTGGCCAFEFLRLPQFATTARHCRSVVLSSTATNVPATRAAVQQRFAAMTPATFAAQHVCRIQPTPSVLAAADQYPGKVWKGMAAFANYTVPAAMAAPLRVQQQWDDNR